MREIRRLEVEDAVTSILAAITEDRGSRLLGEIAGASAGRVGGNLREVLPERP